MYLYKDFKSGNFDLLNANYTVIKLGKRRIQPFSKCSQRHTFGYELITKMRYDAILCKHQLFHRRVSEILFRDPDDLYAQITNNLNRKQYIFHMNFNCKIRNKSTTSGKGLREHHIYTA